VFNKPIVPSVQPAGARTHARQGSLLLRCNGYVSVATIWFRSDAWNIVLRLVQSCGLRTARARATVIRQWRMPRLIGSSWGELHAVASAVSLSTPEQRNSSVQQLA